MQNKWDGNRRNTLIQKDGSDCLFIKKGKIPKNVQETFFMVFIEAKNILPKCPRKDTFFNMFLRR